MKIKNLAIAAFCTIALSACSPTEDAPTVKTLQPKHGLIGKLVQVNDSLKSQYLSRGLVNEGENPTQLDEVWVSIAWADARGALTGWNWGGKYGPKIGAGAAIINGVAQSIVKYIGKCEATNTPVSDLSEASKILYRSGELNDPNFIYKAYLLSNQTNSRSATNKQLNFEYRDSLFNSQAKIGIAHNDVINMIAKGRTIAEIKSVNIPADDQIYNAINSAEFKTFYSQQIAENTTDNNYGSMNNVDDNQLNAILKLYRDAIAMCPDKANDIEYIVNLYVKEISESNELTVAERKEVYSVIAVGAYSKVLWGEEAKLEGKITTGGSLNLNK